MSLGLHHKIPQASNETLCSRGTLSLFMTIVTKLLFLVDGPFKSLSSNVNKYGGFKVVIQRNHVKNLHIFEIINNYSPKAR